MAQEETNYSDELSDLIDDCENPELNLEYFSETNVGVSQEELNRVKTDVMNVLRIVCRLECQMKTMQNKLSLLNGRSVDRLLSQIVSRLDQKANASDLQLIDCKVRQLLPSSGSCPAEGEGKEPCGEEGKEGCGEETCPTDEEPALRTYIQSLIREEFISEIGDMETDIARIKNFIKGPRPSFKPPCRR